MVFQRPPNHHRQRRYLLWVLLLLLLAATLLWILSTVNIIQGVWTTVLNAVFTSLGTIFALLQWHGQAISEHPGAAALSAPDKEFPREQFVQDLANKRKGAILIYTSRKWRGTTLHLVPGLQETTRPIKAASNIVERQIAGQRQFLCHFPAVPPGHYTLVALSKRRRVQVTVYLGHLSEIDWR